MKDKKRFSQTRLHIWQLQQFKRTAAGTLGAQFWAVEDAARMPLVDLAFSLRRAAIPVDHGYSLYSAISRLVLGIHGDDQIGIHPIYGTLIGDRKLAVTQNSQLVLRLPVDRIPDVVVLAGKTLDVAGHSLTVGVPTVRALVPAAAVSSRLVVIKGFMEPEPFLDAVRRQLVELDIRGEPFLVSTGDAVNVNETRDGGTQSVSYTHLRAHET